MASRLDSDTVHVWCASLDAPPIAAQHLWMILNDRERAAAQRYVFARDRRRSAASRGLLRCLLATYLQTAPETVELRFGAHGKPELARARGWHFNVSHSDDLVVYALARDREVGVDLEHVRHMPDAAEIGERFFARAEVNALLRLPEAEIDQGFFVCWTRKEAYLKAHGGGLSVPLDRFEVDLQADDAPTRLRITSDPAEAERWRLYDIQPAAGFLGAICIQTPECRILCWRWIE